MFINRIKTRFQASLLHFACSCLIAGLALILVFKIWYPQPLATATGVTEIFLLVLLVDICLGPLLTLVVFNTMKKELKRDLLIILIVQIAALIYGLYTVAVARPVYIVFAVDRFELVLANDLSAEKLEDVSITEFQSTPWLGPKWAAARIPEDTEERNDLLFQAIDGGDDLAQTPKLYVNYYDIKEKILEKSKPLADLRPFNTSNIKAYDQLIKRYSAKDMKYGYIPLTAGKMDDLAVIIDDSTAKPIEIVELKPW